MDKMIEKFEQKCAEEDIPFDSENQHVRCLAHIINLAAQDALSSLNGTGPENEEEILNEEEDDTIVLTNVIKKV
jgi:hypothetical protein